MLSDFIISQLTDVATEGDDIFISSMPDVPDNCITVYDESGTIEGYQNDYNSDWRGIMIKARGSYNYAYNKIWQCHYRLAGLSSLTFEGLKITSTQIITPPAQIGIDDKGRREFTAHYQYLTTQTEDKNRISI